MSGPVESTKLVYVCAQCGKEVPTTSAWRADAPEGYYFTVRRVTEGRRHSQTPEIFVCDKNCLIEFMHYGIGSHAQRVDAIGPGVAKGKNQ